MTASELEDSEPVSVAIRRRVKAGKIPAFEKWLDEITVAAAGFNGYASMDVVRPVDPANATYMIILRFDSYRNYTTWHQSPQRAELVERAGDLSVGEAILEEAHGLEGWFASAANGSVAPRPARYKMTILTIIGLYPLIVGIGAVVAATTDLAVALATLITVIVVAALATYLVMPWITRSARRWLYPESS